MESDSERQPEKLLTVMIVDDEPMAIEYLRDTIDWRCHGYQIVAEATETPAAIEAFRLHRPHLVLSDIRIPGTDGLDMCRELLNTDPTVKIILITAYGEFSYAKKAMDMGIHQYLLKHEISEERLLEELGKARKEIQNEANENRILARSVVVDSLSGRLNSPRTSGPQRKILEKLGRTLIIMLLREDFPFILLEGHCVLEETDGTMDAIRTLPMQEGYSYIDCLQIDQGIQAHLIAHKDSLSSEAVKRDLKPMIQEHALTRNGKDYSAVIVTSSIGLRDLTNDYRNAVKIFDGFPFLGPRNLVFLQDAPPRTPSESEQSEIDGDLMKIAANLGTFDFRETIETVRKVFGCFETPENQTDVLRTTVHRLAGVIDDWALQNHLVPMDRSSLAESRSMDELMAIFINAIEDMSLEFDSAGPEFTQKISNAILYINKNYSRNLSVSEIAEELGISESNLTKSFRQETGQSVLDYLTGVRINVAKRLLVRTSLKIYQIAEMTGYSTSGYFGRVFLKETQMPPLEFRTRNTRSAE